MGTWSLTNLYAHSRIVLQFGRKVSRQRKTPPPPRRKKRRVSKMARRRERRGIITLLRRALQQRRRVKMTRKTPSSSGFMRQPKFLLIKAGWIIKPKHDVFSHVNSEKILLSCSSIVLVYTFSTEGT